MAITDTKAMIARLEGFTKRNWKNEPGDIKALRGFKKPPMGNLPCVIYANFDTFWLGENIQVLRLLALEGKTPVAELNRVAAALVTRHMIRLGKWKMANTVRLMKEIVGYFEAGGARSYAEFVAVAEAIMLAIDLGMNWKLIEEGSRDAGTIAVNLGTLLSLKALILVVVYPMVLGLLALTGLSTTGLGLFSTFALFGLLHFFLFFEGDILFHYALFGMVAMFLVRLLPAKWLLIGGMLLYVADSPLSSLDLGGWARDEARILALPADNQERIDYLREQDEFVAETRAEGELQAAEKLTQAAAQLAREPQALQLRYMQTLIDISAEKNSTILFPLPMELLTPFLKQDSPRG